MHHTPVCVGETPAAGDPAAHRPSRGRRRDNLGWGRVGWAHAVTPSRCCPQLLPHRPARPEFPNPGSPALINLSVVPSNPPSLHRGRGGSGQSLRLQDGCPWGAGTGDGRGALPAPPGLCGALVSRGFAVSRDAVPCHYSAASASPAANPADRHEMDGRILEQK